MKTATSSHAARQRDVRAMGPYEGRGLLSHSGPWPPLTQRRQPSDSGCRETERDKNRRGRREAQACETARCGGYTCLLHENMKHQQQRSPNASCRGRHNGARAAARWTCPLSRGCTVEAAPTVGTSASRSSSRNPAVAKARAAQALLVDVRAPAEQARLPTQMRDR